MLRNPRTVVTPRRAEAEGITLIDLTRLSRDLWQAMGEEGSKAAFLHLAPSQWPGYPDGEVDDTHLSRAGAHAIAQMVLDVIALDPTSPSLNQSGRP